MYTQNFISFKETHFSNYRKLTKVHIYIYVLRIILSCKAQPVIKGSSQNTLMYELIDSVAKKKKRATVRILWRLLIFVFSLNE